MIQGCVHVHLEGRHDRRHQRIFCAVAIQVVTDANVIEQDRDIPGIRGHVERGEAVQVKVSPVTQITDERL